MCAPKQVLPLSTWPSTPTLTLYKLTVPQSPVVAVEREAADAVVELIVIRAQQPAEISSVARGVGAGIKTVGRRAEADRRVSPGHRRSAELPALRWISRSLVRSLV